MAKKHPKSEDVQETDLDSAATEQEETKEEDGPNSNGLVDGRRPYRGPPSKQPGVISGNPRNPRNRRK
jgi:hypothetical protein